MAKTLALDKQHLPLPTSQDTGGHGKRVTKPALDPYWLEDVNFLSYQPAPVNRDEASLEEWNERLSFMEEDLHWLLKQPHHLFWSQVVFDETLQQSLDSYLHKAPRPYDPDLELPDYLSEKHKHIHRLIFMMFLRMATYKESKFEDCNMSVSVLRSVGWELPDHKPEKHKHIHRLLRMATYKEPKNEHFITPSVFGDILYDNFLFDIVKMMELCILYGGGNDKLLSKMIENIFTQQPKYLEDLVETVPTILEVLDKIEEKCGKSQDGMDSLKKLGSNLDGQIDSMRPKELQDVIFYVMDTALSLNAFLEIYPLAAAAFHQKQFVTRIAGFYEILMPELDMAVKNQNWESQSLRSTVKKHLHLAKIGLAQVCATIISSCCIKPILESSMNLGRQLDYIDEYLELIASLLSEKHFLVVFVSQCNIEEDIDLIFQSTDQIDETRTQFILDGIKAVRKTRGKQKNDDVSPSTSSGSVVTENSGSSAAGAMVASPEDYQTDAFIDDYGGSSAATNAPSGIQIDSLISSVKDLFPELGDGFIEACLEEYTFDASKVINDILEDKLSPGLQELDRNLERSATPPPAVDPDPVTETMLSKRANIYENDEFDVFSRDDVDTTRIHKGKKEDGDTAFSVLADKTDVKAVGNIYDKYQYDKYHYEYADEYDDEYDDTYDEINVGAGDADSADELMSKSLFGRAIVTPRVLRGADADSQEEDDEEDDESEEEKERDLFERPPQHNQAPRHQGRKQQANQEAKQKARQEAIKGQQKGKGQSQNTQKERRYKDKNKSSRANHNRKAMADKKRSRAMGPLG